MNDTQIWTSIIGMLTGMLAFMALVLGVFEKTVATRFTLVDSRFDLMDSRFDRLETTLDAQFERLSQRMDRLDGDVTDLSHRIPDRP